MSNYTKSTNFATKDNLSPGNPLKIVKGTEIDTEFNNIATAVATKTDNASAAITGGTITGITDLAVADGGTGASTATDALNNLLPTQTGNANKYLQTDGTNATWDAVSLSTSDITGTLPVANGGTGVTSSTGTGNVVLSNSPTLVTPALGTPSALVGTNITGTASGLTAGNVTTNANLTGAVTSVGNATSLGSFTSAQLLGALTDETGTGSAVFATSPTLVTPALGTPSALVGTNITGTASGLTAGNVTTNANLTGDVTSVGNATTLTNAPVIAKVLTGYVSGAGTVAATDSILQAIQKLNGNDATNANLTGMVTSVGNATTVVTNANLTGAVTSSGNATSLGSFSSANLLAALTDETGTGSAVFATSPTLVTPILGTPTSATLTNATGLPLTTGVTGQLPVANGGTGTATPSIVAGTNVTVTGTWPNQTIAASGGGGGGITYTTVKTANYTAVANDGVQTNTTSGAFTVTLPATPSNGDQVFVVDSFNTWGTNNLTIGRNGSTIEGVAQDLVCDITGVSVQCVYNGTTWDIFAQVGGAGGSTSPAGSDTQIQYNNAGAFGGITGATTNGTALTLTGAILNGTIGATTPSTGAFTSLSSTIGSNFATTSGNIGLGVAVPTKDVEVSGELRVQASATGGTGVGIEAFAAGGISYFTSYNRTTSAYAPASIIGSTVDITATTTVSGTLKGSATISVGNATPSASGAGITFPATQSASSNANTLDDYEEGTWTPAQGGGLTVAGTFVSSGTYTKIGRQLFISGQMSAASIAVAAGGIISTNLPFSTTGYGAGGFGDYTLTNGAVVITASLSIYSVAAVGASGGIEFAATCIV